MSLPVGAVVLDAVPTQGTGELWLILGAGREPEQGPHVDWSLFPIASRTRFQQYDRPGDRGELRTQDTDPSVDPAERLDRADRHARFQRARDAASGSPRTR